MGEGEIENDRNLEKIGERDRQREAKIKRKSKTVELLFSAPACEKKTLMRHTIFNFLTSFVYSLKII